jgi:hypothetical protein
LGMLSKATGWWQGSEGWWERSGSITNRKITSRWPLCEWVHVMDASYFYSSTTGIQFCKSV